MNNSDPTSEDVHKFIRKFNSQNQLWIYKINDFLIAGGCNNYFKTIYIGYEHEGEMVAAIYPHQSHLEIALALPEDFNDPILSDASRLTWRTLPVLATVRTISDLNQAVRLSSIALTNVQTGAHLVNRTNDYFIRFRNARRNVHQDTR